MTRSGEQAIAMLLADIAVALERGRRVIVELPDGRKPLMMRTFMLAGLAEFVEPARSSPD